MFFGERKISSEKISHKYFLIFFYAKFLHDLDKFLATNLKSDIFTVLVKKTRLIKTSNKIAVGNILVVDEAHYCGRPI